MTSSFDSLFESLLNELSPVTTDFETFGSSLERGIGSEKTGGYLIKDIADTLSITKEEAVRKISKDLYNRVFGETGVNPANTEDDYREAIKTALEDIISKIKEDHPEAKRLKNYDAYRGYTARVISKLADATKEFGERVTKEVVNTAVEDVASETEGLATDGEEGIEDEQETLASEFGDQNTLEEPVADTEDEVKEKAPASFSSAGTYELQDVAAGKLKGEEAEAYQALDNSGAREGTNGETLADTLKRSGITVSKIKSILNSFVRNEILARTDSAEGEGGGEALEGSEENMRNVERDTFAKQFGDAYRDYMKSGGGELSGRESSNE
jgi:hypothetical protein